MKKPSSTAYHVLKIMGVPVFTNEDNDELGNFFISAEEPTSSAWVDYYALPNHYIFGVNPTLDAVLAQHGLMAEWVNPGFLGVYET